MYFLKTQKWVLSICFFGIIFDIQYCVCNSNKLLLHNYRVLVCRFQLLEPYCVSISPQTKALCS